MKGYVNVIKERFARKSYEKTAESNLNVVANSATGLNVSSSDFLRRRSVSPYKQNSSDVNARSSATRNEVKIVHAAISGDKPHSNISEAKKFFASTDDLRNTSSSSSSSSYRVINANQHLMHNASMNATLANNGHHCSDLVKNKIKYLSNSTLNTAGGGVCSSSSYSGGLNNNNNAAAVAAASLVSAEVAKLNGAPNATGHLPYEKINRDEMPKPNFVSSVKTLFEKQIGHSNNNNNHSSASLNNSLNSSHSNYNLVNAANNINNESMTFVANSSSAKTSPTLTAGIVTVKQQHSANQSNLGQYDSLVDKLRQNGTLVYEHSERKLFFLSFFFLNFMRSGWKSDLLFLCLFSREKKLEVIEMLLAMSQEIRRESA